jgi:hypothetical protein
VNTLLISSLESNLTADYVLWRQPYEIELTTKLLLLSVILSEVNLEIPNLDFFKELTEVIS